MARELKIVMSGPHTHNVMVYVDNNPIGLIQRVKFHAAVGDFPPAVEIVFPNLFSNNIDPNYYKQSGSAGLVKSLAQQMWELSELPNVKVTLEEIF